MKSFPYTLRAVARQSPSSPTWLREDALVEVGSVLVAGDAREALQALQRGEGRPALPKLQPGRRYLLKVGELAVSLDGDDLALTAAHATAHSKDHADHAHGRRPRVYATSTPTRNDRQYIIGVGGGGGGGSISTATPEYDWGHNWVCAHVSPDSKLYADPAVEQLQGTGIYTCRTCGHASFTSMVPPDKVNGQRIA